MVPSPTLHPRDTFRPTSSEAEKSVWKALRTQLPPGFHAWHSLRIRDPHGYEGEGGQVEQRDGRWFQNGEPMKKAPLEQGTRVHTSNFP